MAHLGRIALALALATVMGCASGGGGREEDEDAGRGSSGNDGGIRLMDSGPTPGFDAGPRIDSGPTPGFDAGPRRDAGFDAGMSTTCSESPCRLTSPQCGCASGQGCHLNASSDRACAVLGTASEGDACDSVTGCRAGDQCLGLGGGASCLHYCSSDADCTMGPGSICLLTLADDTGATIPGVTLCTTDCDPGLDVGCSALGTGCTIYQESSGAMRYFTGCREAGAGFAGDPCTVEEDCIGGHFCASGSCYQYCADDFDCPGFELCNPFDTPVLIGGVEYGYCF